MRILLFIFLIASLLACHNSPDKTSVFRTVTDQSGIDHRYLPLSVLEQQPDQAAAAAGGIGLADLDRDGFLDVLLPQVGAQSATPSATGNDVPASLRVYMNTASGEVRFKPGQIVELPPESGFPTGLTVGDLSNDGWPDIYLSTRQRDRVCINDGHGRITECSEIRKESGDQWTADATTADFDLDGDLDLFISGFVTSLSETDECHAGGDIQPCTEHGIARSGDRLLLNESQDGQLKLTDVTAKFGLGGQFGHSLGAVFTNINNDQWPDLFVARGSSGNTVWINRNGWRFIEIDHSSGLAFAADGRDIGARAVVVSDIDRNGDEDLLVSSAAPYGLHMFKRTDAQRFRDRTIASGLASHVYGSSGFGLAVEDFDANGGMDIILINGEVSAVQNQIDSAEQFPYRQPDRVISVNPDGTMTDTTDQFFGDNLESHSGRGLAAGDLDNDGDADLITTSTNHRVSIYENTSDPEHWLGIVPRLASNGRIATGARVSLGESDFTHSVQVRRASGFAGSGDPRVRFVSDSPFEFPVNIKIIWPDGAKQAFMLNDSGEYHTLVKSAGEQ